MRNPKGSGRKPGRRRQRGDDGPDLFAAKLSEVVKQAFEGTGGFAETHAQAPTETEVLPTDSDPIEPDLNPSIEAAEGALSESALETEPESEAPGLDDSAPPLPPEAATSESPPVPQSLEGCATSETLCLEGSAPQLLPGAANSESRGAAEPAIHRAESPLPSRAATSEPPLSDPFVDKGAQDACAPSVPLPEAPDNQSSPISGIHRPLPPTGPLPARMLNEFVYCPRLFYYEYVEGVFVENADTIRGAAVHARVDKGSGAMPPADGATAAKRKRRPDSDAADMSAREPSNDAATKSASEGPEIIHSRSATLGSDRLGVIAKLDLVEMRIAAPESGTGIPSVDPEDLHRQDACATSAEMGATILNAVLTSSASPESSASTFASSAFSAVKSDSPPPAADSPPSDLSGLELPVYEVCPVDYKAGAPREGEEGNELWPADRMQLGLQILILRENGYRCDHGIIYYRATKQRVPLDWTPELEAWVISQIEAAHLTMKGPIPPPLIGSPKCVRCSLNSVCLPDETRFLADAANAQKRNAPVTSPATAPGVPVDKSPSVIPPPRRLIAARDDRRVLYLNKPGVRVGRKDELITVKEENRTLEEVRIGDLTHVSLFGNIQISTQAIQVLCELEVPITFFSMGGWFYGITRGHELKNVFTRIEQFRLAADPMFCLALARRIVNGKIRNHRTMLMRLHLQPPAPIVAKLKTMAESALQANTLEELLGTEGAAAHFYFSAFSGMLKVEDDFADIESPKAPQLCFNFAGRNRRPPTDPVNALLSLAYSLLAKDCTLAAMAVGLDPYIGFYHQPRFGRPALALDIMEEFRPLIAESAVLTCINNRMILPRHFVRAGQAVNLSQEGRKFFFQAYERRMSATIKHPIFEYEVSYRRVLELQFRLLARYLTGEISEYPPFVTR